MDERKRFDRMESSPDHYVILGEFGLWLCARDERDDPNRERMDSRTAKVDKCIDSMELQMLGIVP